MFSIKSLPRSVSTTRFAFRKIQKVCRNQYTINFENSKSLEKVKGKDLFHILAFHKKGSNEGIYSVTQRTDDDLPVNHIVAFMTFDDAFRFKTLLEAELTHTPYIQFASRFDLDYMCNVGNYKCRVVDEDALVTPPTSTVPVTEWEQREALLNGDWTVEEK